MEFSIIFFLILPFPSAPTLFSKPKIVESRPNPDQNLKKTSPNPDPMGTFSGPACFTNTGPNPDFVNSHRKSSAITKGGGN